MELSISRNDLSRMLERASSAVSSRSPMAIYQCALLEATADTLTVSGTDSFVSAKSFASAAVKKPGSICVDAKKIAAIVKALPSGDVKLAINAAGLQVSAGKSKFKLATVDPVSFPPMPSIENAAPLAKLDADVVSRLIAQGTYAWTSDETRPFLAVALLELADDSAAMVTTDGARLAFASSRVTHGPASRCAIPTRGMGEIRKLCDGHKGGQVELHRSGPLLIVTAADATVSVLLGDEGQFPPYKRIIPASSAHRTTLSRELLIDAVKRVSLVASQTEFGKVKLEFSPGEIALLVESDADAADERIECDCDFSLAVGIRSANLAQALAALTSDEVVLEIGGPKTPLVVRSPVDSDCLGLVMPMDLT